MIRDPGPLYNLGNGVMSRDLPVQEGEQEGDAPNSGFISRALNDHPLMRFVATSAATMAVAAVLSKVVKEGGLKLVKFAEEKVANKTAPDIITRAVQTGKQIREHLDELEGVSRYIDGESNPYSKLVYGTDKLTTGYEGVASERFGFGFLTKEERRLAGNKNGYGSPAAVWQYRDELQQRLVRAGRRMPYELPAFYIGQKGVVDPIFGKREQGKSKTKWYNPVDVVADFTTESVKSMATMILPFEAAGAAGTTLKSSIHTLKYAESDIRSLTPARQKLHQNFVNVSEVLSEVGHDFASLTNKLLKKSAQTSGAFNAAATEFKAQESGFVQTLHNLRAGWDNAQQRALSAQSSKAELRKTQFKNLFTGYTDGQQRYGSVVDLIPAFRGTSSAISVGVKEFKGLGEAYDAMQSPMAFKKVIDNSRIFTGNNGQNALIESIKKIQSQHSSRLSNLAKDIRILGGGGPGSETFAKSQFNNGMQADAYKDLLESQLISKGINKRDAERFIAHINIESLPKSTSNITKIVSIGKSKIIEQGSNAKEQSEDFFGQIIKRYSGIKGSKNLIENPNFNANALADAVERSRNAFTSTEFQKRLNNRIANSWNKFQREDLHQAAGGILKPKKALYQDFIGEPSDAKLEFMQRKTAETLGIKLTHQNGQMVTNDMILDQLKNRGIDPNNFTDLRAFLIKNKKMTSGIFSGGQNLFGLQQVTIDEAQDRGMFKHIPDEEQTIIRQLAGRMAIQDPVSKSIGLSRLDGVYKSSQGEILDFTALKSTASSIGNFLASEFKIPILGFNPTDLTGYNSFKEMYRRSSVQYVSSRSVQPFLAEGAERPDFYMFHRTKGVKGVVTSFRTDENTGELISEALKGSYRALPTNTMDLLTRHTRYASDLQGANPEQIRGELNSNFLNKILSPSAQEKMLKIRDRMAVSSEQPNSIFGQISRFRKRGYDPDNPEVMARLLAGEEISIPVGRGKPKTLGRLTTLADDSIAVVDRSNNVIPGFEEPNLIRGYFSLRDRTLSEAGMPIKVMKKLEELDKDLFTFRGKSVSEIESHQDLIAFGRQIEKTQSQLARQLRSSGQDPTAILSSSSRMSRLMDEGDLSAVSMMAQKSPTISTKYDELKNEIFRYISQSNQLTSGNVNKDEIFIKIQTAVDELIKSGAISPAQRTEAQAAGLGTLFNLSSFMSFKQEGSNVESARLAISQAMGLSAGAETKGLYDPFIKGDIAQIGGSIRKRFSPLLTPAKRAFGTAPYRPDEMNIDPLGSGQNTTFVPTFGTVFGRNPQAAIKNALGITTYSDPESFSLASVPVSQGVERLNRYFGTLGMQVDVSKFNGPLDLFTRGMVGKRVLPLYAAGTAAMTIDRTMGGIVNKKDENGERVYSPLILGTAADVGVQAHAAAAGLIPGGMSYQEKRDQLVDGEVPIRQGRFWPLGNTPFKGGKIMYYRPSWYRKLQGGAMFTSDTYGSPAEKFLFDNDISPLRPLDPYRFERKHYEDRPYPVTGEYFSGPFGPLVPIANATIGRILKPQKIMHGEELTAGLASYAPAGQFGAYDATAFTSSTQVGGYGGGGYGGGGFSGVGGGFGFGGGASGFGGGGYQGQYNKNMASRAGSTFMARGMTRNSISNINSGYSQLAYGPPKVSKVMNPRIVPSGSPLMPGRTEFQATEAGYRAQEMLGIYGFAFGSARESLGFGKSDLDPQRAVLQSASKAYGSSRAFWDLNLGGLGDVPIGGSEGIGNIEFSEIVRRFIPKDRTGVDYLNPIQNKMGKENPWLPGAEYYMNFRTGDPFTKVQEGEIRLPGVAYERFNKLHPDETGRYGLIDQLNILGDVAPYSQQFKRVNSLVNKKALTPEEKIEVANIRQQVEDTTVRHDFSEYKYKYSSAEETATHPIKFGMGRIGEMLAHSNNFILTKAIGKRTALEDWERSNVYGTTFPQWQKPIESYIKPMLQSSTQRNPIVASASLAAAGAFFGRTPRARLFGTVVGGAAGALSSVGGKTQEFISGERYIPKKRKEELALEEYSDILSYVKNTRLANMASASGDMAASTQFRSAARRTMYGANIDNPNIDNLSFALPKRKREHFKAMMDAPVQERGKILSTAGRLERRMYEAAWGMDVEKLPDLNEYFTSHELPSENWEGWNPNTNLDHVKIKTGQHMGLDMSQMGYYPQQIKEANLSNASYPDFFGTSSRGDIRARLERLMAGTGVTGTITPINTPFGSQQISVSAGVR